ncbi:hypothetical protein LAB1_12740 [Roseibium sp. LAB1]
MGTAELVLGKDVVRVTGEVAIREKQELDQIVGQRVSTIHIGPFGLLGPGLIRILSEGRLLRFEIYVSHIDLILIDCYFYPVADEMIGLFDAFSRIR